MTTKRTVTVTIGDEVTITIDEAIPLVPTEQAERECAMCRCKPSEGVGHCSDDDCKRRGPRPVMATGGVVSTNITTGEEEYLPDSPLPRSVQTLDELRARLHGGDAS